MNKLSVIVLSVLLLGVSIISAEETTAPENQSAVVQAPATKSVEVGNKICPVSGDKVGEMGDVVKYEYNGKIYNLCCPMCKNDFAKDPAKYSKIAEDEVAKEKTADTDQGK